MHGYSWLPGILTSWNLASSHFCQNSGNSGMINPEAFVMFQFLSIYLPSDPSWMSKSGPENLMFLEMGETGKGLSLSCHSHVQLPGCSVWIVSQGFVKSNSPTCPLDLVHSLLWPSESLAAFKCIHCHWSFLLSSRKQQALGPSTLQMSVVHAGKGLLPWCGWSQWEKAMMRSPKCFSLRYEWLPAP